jgi:hypothetical protein
LSAASEMDIHESTRRYERWLKGHIPLVAADLDEKHRRMGQGVFLFMRATFYRWCQSWRELAPDERRAPAVCAVGDLHLENFGTWRDTEGRLIWGINDFDEATRLPWTQDLVRLATSAHLAIADEHLHLKRRDASAAILQGYVEGIACGGQAFVLEERHDWLREAATSALREPVEFWRKMDGLPPCRSPPKGVAAVLESAMPQPGLRVQIRRRVAGMGSLGRPRFVALSEWNGGKVAREAKATAPSAYLWAAGGRDRTTSSDLAAIRSAIRVPDPTMKRIGPWLVRRLAPHCARIELGELPKDRDEGRLLRAMGFETANIHLGTKGAREAIQRDLRTRTGRQKGPPNAGWLDALATTFSAAVERDWRHWCRG